jgi:uncharacterized protein YneF (UPF0154 family)
MIGLLIGLFLVVCLIGGVFYGYAYVSACVNGTPVLSELVRNLNYLIGREPK